MAIDAGNPVRLARDGVVCVVAPALGGAILSLEVNGRAVLRAAPPGATDPLDTASFALLPFANRIADGRFRFGDREARLAAHPISLPHALHGDGWTAAWSVVALEPGRVTLRHDHDGKGWPWAYRAEQMIALADDGIDVTIAICNVDSTAAMPAGAGIHPYFRRTADSGVTARATRRWRNDASGLAVEAVADDRFARGGCVPIAAFDGCDDYFIGGGGDLVVATGGARVRLGMADAAGFHLLAPADGDFFCVEPVSHAPNSFGRGEIGADEVLAPGIWRRWTFPVRVA